MMNHKLGCRSYQGLQTVFSCLQGRYLCPAYFKKLKHENYTCLTYCHRRWFHTTSKIMAAETRVRRNEINIQMLSGNLHRQIFGNEVPNKCDPEVMEKVKNHLKAHNLWDRESTKLNDVKLEMPELIGQNISEHFHNLALKQTEEYKELVDLLLGSNMPPMPKQWIYQPGWTKYSGKETSKVDFPEENVMIFDVEVLVPEGHYPTLAVALTDKYWYSWVSDLVIQDRYRYSKHPDLADLIPLETEVGSHVPPGGQWQKKVVIGHNVGFDRSFIKEQYYVEKSQLRFLDTMSLHIAICGQTTFQRILYQATKKATNRKEVREYMNRIKHIATESEWKEVSTMNNISDVYQLHCKGQPIKKEARNVFIEGTMKDVRKNFQLLMKYCALDVKATTAIFKKVYPEYSERFPSPVTLSGMMEMGTAYLPVNENWDHYIEQSNVMYNKLQRELKITLMKIANEACALLENDQYKNDPWLWDLDWSVKEYKLKKPEKKSAKSEKDKDNEKTEEDLLAEKTEEDLLAEIYATSSRIPKTNQHMPGYPKWYRDLCPKENAKNWSPGPSLISTQTRVTPKLMRLTWEGYPLHYSEKYGWGYLVPSAEKAEIDVQNIDMANVGDEEQSVFPVKEVFEFCEENCPTDLNKIYTDEEFETAMSNTASNLHQDMHWSEKGKHWVDAGAKKKGKIPDLPVKEAKPGEYVPGCYFVPLPHKDGANNRVGNPLAKDFLGKVEAGILKANSGGSADRALKLGKMCAYWKNNQDRIMNQMKVALQHSDLPATVTSKEEYQENAFYGAIVPRVISAGTITRRAVEPTWLTASNAYVDRIGSELRAMVQAPPGYKFVGADVDSQELWIAALIGDSKTKMHGGTAFGWMTLQGKKSDKTDLHSKTAETVGISRDHAKVINYGRIYGAGMQYAQKLLMQYNHRLSEKDAAVKARIMYKSTKGERKIIQETDENGDERRIRIWKGGSESDMFNQLEAIAQQNAPATPVLSCRISKALEPHYVGNDFMTSRINWVVQSSAVDYLHLMLVCMKWLIEEFQIDARFSISIHDEVRYLVNEEDKYRLALALQISNLLTRSIFAYKLGIRDLPQSVAFFSAVDIDSCIRKEVNMDCKTPSNPHGMERGYGLPHGEAFNIYEILKKTNGGKLEPQTCIEDERNQRSFQKSC